MFHRHDGRAASREQRPMRAPSAHARTSRRPCKSTAHGQKKGDFEYESCDSFCSLQSARIHCNLCRCRECSSCATSVRNMSGQRAIWRASAGWCAAMLRRPTHLFRRMWASEPWARMTRSATQSGRPCWEVHREQRRRDAVLPGFFFEHALNGSFCQTNWYEGHAGALGEVDRPPQYLQAAPALLGFDAGIHRYCLTRLSPSERQQHAATNPGGTRKGGAVARACVAANQNILNMVGRRATSRVLHFESPRWLNAERAGRLEGAICATGALFLHAGACPTIFAAISSGKCVQPRGCSLARTATRASVLQARRRGCR